MYNGIFLDYYALRIPSYVPNTALAIDMKANAAAIPGDGTYDVPFTHTRDIAAYTVSLLSVEKWEPKYYIAGDTKTWNDMVALAEKARGVKFQVAYDDAEKLRSGEVTKLPGHQSIYETFGPVFAKVQARLSLFMVEVSMVGKGPHLNEMFPEIEAFTAEKALLG